MNNTELEMLVWRAEVLEGQIAEAEWFKDYRLAVRFGATLDQLRALIRDKNGGSDVENTYRLK